MKTQIAHRVQGVKGERVLRSRAAKLWATAETTQARARESTTPKIVEATLLERLSSMQTTRKSTAQTIQRAAQVLRRVMGRSATKVRETRG